MKHKIGEQPVQCLAQKQETNKLQNQRLTPSKIKIVYSQYIVLHKSKKQTNYKIKG